MLEELVRNQPANPELHHQLGICYSGACRPHDSCKYPGFNLILRARAFLDRFRAAPRFSAPNTSIRLGMPAFKIDRPEAAIPYLTEAAELYATLGLARRLGAGAIQSRERLLRRSRSRMRPGNGNWRLSTTDEP